MQCENHFWKVEFWSMRLVVMFQSNLSHQTRPNASTKSSFSSDQITRPKPQNSLSWIYSQPHSTLVLCGTTHTRWLLDSLPVILLPCVSTTNHALHREREHEHAALACICLAICLVIVVAPFSSSSAPFFAGWVFSCASCTTPEGISMLLFS